MRTVTKEIGIYFFDELPEELQKEVLIKNHDFNTDFYWSDMELDYWKDKLNSMGFEDADISFSGFWSQGDGASFTARCDHQKILNKVLF